MTRRFDPNPWYTLRKHSHNSQKCIQRFDSIGKHRKKNKQQQKTQQDI